ncbi:BN159_2729 family protein [Streptomyces sp. CNZ748]|uniref:BN159_2729 family protein n=1 Tax=Streptomyces sp. CNZ748 TaxID=2885160 RepID=UPI0027E1F028|nr:BN159_2729 family protein [Streptomyces sp. CNZ748]
MNEYPPDAVPVVRVTVAVPRHDFFLTATPAAEVYAVPYVPAPHPGTPLAPHGTADGGHPSASPAPTELERQALAWDAARERARAVARTIEREVGGHPDVRTVWADGDTVHVLLRLEPPFTRRPGWCAYFGITASAECTAPHILAGEGSRDGVRVTAAVQPAGPAAVPGPADAGRPRPGAEGTPGATRPWVAEAPGRPASAAPGSLGGHEHHSAGLGSLGVHEHIVGRGGFGGLEPPAGDFAGHGHPVGREEADDHEPPAGRQEFGGHEHPVGREDFGDHEHPAEREDFLDHEHPAERQDFGGRAHPAPQGGFGGSEDLDDDGTRPDGQGDPAGPVFREREHQDAYDPGLRDQEHQDGTAPADDVDPDGTGAGGRPDRGAAGLGPWTELAASGVLPLAHLAGTGHDEPDDTGAGARPDQSPWAGPEGQAGPDDPASPRPAGVMRPFLLGGTAYDLALPYRDVHGETWYFQGQRSFDGMPLMSLDGRPERCSLAHVAEYAGPLTPVSEPVPEPAPDEGDR